MDSIEQDESTFEPSVQELRQIIPKNVLDGLSPVQGGQWRIHRRGPNDYEAVYSLRAQNTVYDLARHSVSTVVSLDEIYNTFPIHRAHSLDREQTERILPQIEHLLYRSESEHETIPQQNLPMTGTSGAIPLYTTPLNPTFVQHPSLELSKFSDSAEHNIGPAPTHHVESFSNGLEISVPFSGISQNSDTLDQTTVGRQLVQHGPTSHSHQDETSTNEGTVAAHIIEESDESPVDEFQSNFSSSFDMNRNRSSQPVRMGPSNARYNTFAQASWASSAENGHPNNEDTQGSVGSNGTHITMSDLEREQAEFLQNFGSFMAEEQIIIAEQAMLDTHPQSPGMNATIQGTSRRMGATHFQTGMNGYPQGNMILEDSFYFNDGNDTNESI